MNRINSWMIRHEKLMWWLLTFIYEAIAACIYVILVLVTVAYGREFPNTFVGDEPLSLTSIIAGMFLAWWIIRVACAPDSFTKEKKP